MGLPGAAWVLSVLEELYEVTLAEPDDRNYVVDSWRRSLQRSPSYGPMPTRGFVAWATEIIHDFLGPDERLIQLRPSDRLYVARDREKPAYIYGWLLGRDLGPGFALVYAYTRGAHRKQGVCKALLAQAIEETRDGPLLFAFRTRRYVDAWLARLEMAYCPIERLERRQGAA